jgi:hypothetical protein
VGNPLPFRESIVYEGRIMKNARITMGQVNG